MSNAVEEARRIANLRQRAADKLDARGRDAAMPVGQVEALAVLHQLASSPTTAGDALALLHELQVHQVELDLQQEELRRSRAEFETALRRQADLVERAPVGYMTIDASTVLYEINLAGARLLGAVREDLLGRQLAGFLAPHSVDALQVLLERARAGRVPETGKLQLMPIPGSSRTVHACVDQDSIPERFLLVLMSPA